MREYKFRGKATATPEELENMGFSKEGHDDGWFTGNLVMMGETPYIVGDFIEANEEYTTNEFWVKVHPESVGQYIGLKDKNNTDIFENDVILYKSPFSGEEQLFVVEWIESDTCFIVGGVRVDYVSEFGEVIGNAFEKEKTFLKL